MKKLMVGMTIFTLSLMLGVGVALVSPDRAEAGIAPWCGPINPPEVVIRIFEDCDYQHESLGDYIYICYGMELVSGDYCNCVWKCVPSTKAIVGPPLD